MNLILNRKEAEIERCSEELRKQTDKTRYWKSEVVRFQALVQAGRERELALIIPKETQSTHFDGVYDDSMFPHPMGVEGPESIPVRARLQIRYRRADGTETDRLILTRTLWQEVFHTEYRLTAFCSLRGEDREFLVSRILKCVDTETGEFVHDLVDHLKRRYLASQ